MTRSSVRWTVAAVAPLILVVALLGWLQWRWIDRVADGERDREAAYLRTAALRFSTALDVEITRAHFAFSGPAMAETLGDQVSGRIGEWNRLAPYPELVRGVIVTPEDGVPVLVTRDGKVDRIEGAFPPESLASDLGGAPLVPLMGGPPMPRFGQGGRGPRPPGLRMVVLDPEYLSRKLLPELYRVHFTAGGTIRVSEGDRVWFQSGPTPSEPPDFTGVLFRFRPECLGAERGMDRGPGRRWPPFRFDISRHASFDCPEPPPGRGAPRWTLAAHHRSGSLAAAARHFRAQSLAVSAAGHLALLAAVGLLGTSLVRARRLAQRQIEFAMSVSHELRTPLSVIRLAADNLKAGLASSPEQAQQYGAAIYREAETLGNMVDQVLTFSQFQGPDAAARFDTIDPAVPANQAAASALPVFERARMELQTEIDSSLPAIRGDTALLSAALSNLLHNAVKYASDGRLARLKVYASGGSVIFEVSDCGPGIPTKDLRKVFRPFYRTAAAGRSQAPGLGLGLHLVQRTAEIHGGRAWARSSPEGTRFSLEIPLPP